MGYSMLAGRCVVNADDGARRYATSLQIATDEAAVSLLNTTTIFGTSTDVALSELALEMLFPADPETVAIVSKLSAGEQAGTADITK